MAITTGGTTTTTTTRGATTATGGGTTTTRGATTIRFAIGTLVGGDGIAGAIALGGAGGKSGRKEQLAR